jgi:hypothetical protein
MIIYPCNNSGSSYYRLIAPAEFLKTHGYIKNVRSYNYYLTIEQIKELNESRVHVQRQFYPEQIKFLGTYKLASIKIVNDLDDLLWDLPKHHPLYGYFTKEFIDQLVLGFKLSDLVVVSSERLADNLYKTFGIKANVLENLIKCSYRKYPTINRDKKLRVVWSGSPSHEKDLEIIKDLVLETIDAMEWTFVGYLPPYINRSQHIVRYIPFQEPEQYFETLSTLDLDVAVIPLEYNEFNMCKSHSKMLEFASLGIPSITTDIEPYKENPCFKIKDNDKTLWRKALLRYNKDEGLRLEHAHAAYEYSFNYTYIAQHRKLFDCWFV